MVNAGSDAVPQRMAYKMVSGDNGDEGHEAMRRSVQLMTLSRDETTAEQLLTNVIPQALDVKLNVAARRRYVMVRSVAKRILRFLSLPSPGCSQLLPMFYSP